MPLRLPKLAIDGGTPVRSEDWAPWPSFAQDEIQAAAEVLASGRVNYHTGSQGKQFEQEFAERVGCRYGVAVSNGTVALEAALAAVGVEPGDEVIVTCRSFVASATCCVLRGAVPVFADVDPVSQNVTADTIAPLIGPRTKAIVAVHLAGWPCEMDAIMRLADVHRLKVIEDCAQAHGATYRGRPVGSLGHVAAFSFCQDKIMTTGGEGGLVTTNNPAVYDALWSFKDHGKSLSALGQPNPHGVFCYVHESFGTNARMTEMQAAIGRTILPKLERWVAQRRAYASMLNDRLSQLEPLRVTLPPDDVEHAYYKYYVFVRSEYLRAGWSRDRIVEAIRAEGIPCGSGICPEIYREGAYVEAALVPKHRLPMARTLGETSIMFQVHPTLNEGHILDTSRAIEKVVAAATTEVYADESRAA